MNINTLCPPALIYLVFSLTQIILDLFKNLYNTALIKFITMSLFTVLLNLLCKNGLGVVSWIIVFIPFITLTLTTVLILFALGLSPEKGRMMKIEPAKHSKNIKESTRQMTHNKL